MNDESENFWTVGQGVGQVIATAIHDGHELRPEVAAAIQLAAEERLREEDPFTGEAVRDVPNHIVVHRSRFEFDLNRGQDEAVYRTPKESWGLPVWKANAPSEGLVARSLAFHAEYYRELSVILDAMAARHGQFVLLDVHSYNHRREGPQSPPEPQENAPDINIGTISMPRDQWAWLLDPLIGQMRGFDFNGRSLDVRENVAFQGKGEQTRFVHQRYPGQGCAIALEFKKFYMDEWTGEPHRAEVEEMRRFLAFVAAAAADLLR